MTPFSKLALVLLNDVMDRETQQPVGMLSFDLGERARSLFEFRLSHMRWFTEERNIAIPVVVVSRTHDMPATREFLEENKYFGLSPDQVHHIGLGSAPMVYPELEDLQQHAKNDEEFERWRSWLSERTPGDVFSEDGRPALRSRGRFGAITGLVASGILGSLIDRGIEYINISSIENLGATLDPVCLGLLLKMNCDCLVEVTRRRGVEEGLLTVNVKGWLRLMHHSELPDPDLDKKIDDIATGTYWLDVAALISALELNDTSLPRSEDQVTRRQLEQWASGRLKRRVKLVRHHIGDREVLLKEFQIPLHGLTATLKTKAMRVERDRYVQLDDLKAWSVNLSRLQEQFRFQREEATPPAKKSKKIFRHGEEQKSASD